MPKNNPQGYYTGRKPSGTKKGGKKGGKRGK